MMIKKTYRWMMAALLLMAMALPLRTRAAGELGQLHVSRVDAYVTDGVLHLTMRITYSSNLLNRGQTLRVSPSLRKGGDTCHLPPMLFNGQSRVTNHLDRDVLVVADDAYGNFHIDMEYQTRYYDWMDGASLCFTSELRQDDELIAMYEDCVFDRIVIGGKNGYVPRPYGLSLRTNLLLPLLNVGLELPIGNRWSVAADVYYPWLFRSDDHKNCLQAAAVSAEGRYWLGKRHRDGAENRIYRLQGHSIGAFGAVGKYDFEHNYKGDQGEFWVAGIDYLYAVPVCKGRMHIELSVAVGYFQAKAYSYHVYEQPGGKGYYDDRNFRKVMRYAGPVKATVALVIPLGS